MPNRTSASQGPLVSVIMPTYNRAHTLPRAIRSVLAQTYGNLELIVADDASADQTPELMATIADPRLRYVRHEINRGAGAARNLGLAHARGDFIAFQDSDDEWLLDKLSFQLEMLQAAQGKYGATFGGKLIYGRDPAGRFGDGLSDYRPHQAHSVKSGCITPQMLSQNLISPQTLLMKADVAREAGRFDERLPNNEDWEFMLRLSMKTDVLFTNRPVVVAYISEDSISLNLRSNARSFMAITRKHRETFGRTPRVYAQKLFATGRYLYQLKRYRAARNYLYRALKIHPWSHKTWLRFLQAALRSAGLPWRRGKDVPGPGALRAHRRRLLGPVSMRFGAPADRDGAPVPFSGNEPASYGQRADTR